MVYHLKQDAERAMEWPIHFRRAMWQKHKEQLDFEKNK